MRAEDAYVSLWRAMRPAAARTGLLTALEQGESTAAAHLRSLFAIHDVTDMMQLDLAWWTYCAIDTVERFLASDDRPARVFEYGAGASTAWLARRAGEVTSVEHDQGFADVLAPLLEEYPNVSLQLVPPVSSPTPRTGSQRRGHENFDFTDYVRAIDDAAGAFDLVVVDGRARMACVRQAIPRLAPGGIVLLDNANRTEYRPVGEDSSLEVRVLRGLTPCLPYPTSTALIRPR